MSLRRSSYLIYYEAVRQDKYLTMRKLINLILESSNELLQFKADITSRIKELPADDSSLSALKEIEDLLKHINAGGRMGIINGELKSVHDTTVDAARKELARYILSIPQTPEQ